MLIPEWTYPNSQMDAPGFWADTNIPAMADSSLKCNARSEEYLSGPRQAGKITLVRQLAGDERRYLTLDDELTRLAAQENPVGLIRDLSFFTLPNPLAMQDAATSKQN